MKRRTQSTIENFFKSKTGKYDSVPAYIPLAERQRPKQLEDVIGQENIIGQGTSFYEMIMNDEIHNTILYGPPGCGKTTIARIIK